MSERDNRGCYMFPYPGQSYATRSHARDVVEFDMDSDGMYVRLESGRGYNTMHCSTYVDMDVLVELMRRAGLEVTPRRVDAAPTCPSGDSLDPE